MQQATRDAIVTAINAAYPAAYPTLPIAYDNSPFDWDNPPPAYVEVEIEFNDGSQIGPAAAPKTRMRGFVRVCYGVRRGQGTRDGLGVLDWFSSLLGYKAIGKLQIQAPMPDGTSEPPGWYLQHLKFPFYVDQT